MKTYKELKDSLFDEVSKIDLSKLSLTGYGNSYKEFAELLKVMASIPPSAIGEVTGGMIGAGVDFALNNFSKEVPKIKEEEVS